MLMHHTYGYGMSKEEILDMSISEFYIRFYDIYEIFGMFNGDKEHTGRRTKRTFEETLAEAEKMGINIIPGKKIKKKPLFKK